MPATDDVTSDDEDINAGELVEFTDSQGNRQFGLILVRSTNAYEDGHTDEYVEVAVLPTIALMTVDQVRKLNTKDKPDASQVKEGSSTKASGIIVPDNKQNTPTTSPAKGSGK